MSTDSLHEEIIVGVDGSPQSEAAVRWAVAEAVMRDEQLRIVHVLPLIGGWTGVGLSGSPLAEETFQWQQREAQQLVENAVQVARGCAGGDTLRISGDTLQLSTETSIVPTLVDLTKQARMIVVGDSGQGAVRRTLLGSVSTALIHHAHCPVAVVHGEVSPEQVNAPIVVGVDGSPVSERATELAFEEASLRHVELVALHALSDAEWLGHAPTIPWDVVTADVEVTLAERLASWQERYPDVVVRRIVVRNQPARHLLAESESAQLVVVGSHGRGGFAGMLLGSVSSAVVHATKTPVIVARND